MGKLFVDEPEPVTIYPRYYIEDRGNPLWKNDQRTCTQFLAKYCGLSLYDIGFEKIYSIDDEDIHIVTGYGYYLIGNADHPDGTSTDHEIFSFMMNCLTESKKLTRIQIFH